MRVAVVHDRPCARRSLEALLDGAGHRVLWTAADGLEAARRCAEARPDLLVLGWSGAGGQGPGEVAALVEAVGCPVLVVASSLDRDAPWVFQAMGAGALDAVATPVVGGQGDTAAAGSDLLRKIDTIEKLIGRKKPPKKTHRAARKTGLDPRQRKLVAIGASTGGPQAITTILRALPTGFTAAVVVVQHMDRKFTSGLTSWLNAQTRAPVTLIANGGRPTPGVVHVPTSEHHLVLTPSRTFAYTNVPEDNFYHPSVDVFYQSAAAYWPGKMMAVLLTGMGRDGAEGLLTLKKMGHHTIAQDRETSVVYGMPKAARELGAASEILGIDAIAQRVAAFV